jgi:hypothetical protein
MLRAAAAHLQSDWTMIAVGDAALPGLGPRVLATGPQGQLIVTRRSEAVYVASQLGAV